MKYAWIKKFDIVRNNTIYLMNKPMPAKNRVIAYVGQFCAMPPAICAIAANKTLKVMVILLPNTSLNLPRNTAPMNNPNM